MMDRALDVVVAVLVVTLVWLISNLYKSVEAVALWGAEAPHSTSHHRCTNGFREDKGLALQPYGHARVPCPGRPV